jgi:thiamine-monophosphate kinase
LHDGTAISTDTLVAGVHFDERLSAADVGYKAVAVSVSDVAAMGATPSWVLLNLTLPAPLDTAWVEQFAKGVGQACAAWDIALIGGDTTRGPVTVVSTTVGGPCAASPLTRAGAQPGDDVWVSGTLGAAAVGYLSAAPSPEALSALRRPSPPVALGPALALRGLATAAMDLSDGLVTDAVRLARASAVALDLQRAALPLGPSLTPDDATAALTGGEDYQLLFTARPGARAALEALAQELGLSLTRIGSARAGAGLRVDGEPAPPAAFSHFGGDV